MKANHKSCQANVHSFCAKYFHFSFCLLHSPSAFLCYKLYARGMKWLCDILFIAICLWIRLYVTYIINTIHLHVGIEMKYMETDQANKIKRRRKKHIELNP